MVDRLFPGRDDAEFAEFMSAPEVAPPRMISDQILGKVHADLNPSASWMFSKVGLIHLITGLLTLVVCPQFGIGWTDLSFRFFDHLGGHHSTLCTLTCGAIFLGSGSFVTSWFLRPEELRVGQRLKYIHYPLYALFSLGLFLTLSTYHQSVIQNVVWLLGGVGSMVMVTLLVLPLRMRLKPAGVQFT